MKKIVNVLAFPGTNCQQETARALRKAGFKSSVLRWNEDQEIIAKSDGLVIAGGFSFEDRGRSGVIAANSAVSNVIRRMAHEGKPILGICNGAQILVETGLVPGFHRGVIEMALSRNRRQDETGILGSGFYHDFIFLKPTGKQCAWTHFEGVLKLPIAHGEGRFIGNKETISAVMKNGQNALTYCHHNGEEDPHFPVNPNGSVHNLAAVCNPEGNVMAMMPHPERIDGGQKIFESLHTFFAQKEENRTDIVLPPQPKRASILPKQEYDVELFVTLKITDNTAKTMEIAFREKTKNYAVSLSRAMFWGITGKQSPEEIMHTILNSEAFFNENKEVAIFRVGNDFFTVRNGKIAPYSASSTNVWRILAQEKDDILGEEKAEYLQKNEGHSLHISSGVVWEFSEKPNEDEVLSSALFANPISGELRYV